ncbi:hypothetical protein [Paramagnetospirillum kuznetsovii]|uniref:hypothetical protein n=1 Tax=Paramagnetospirillum kuznetsovii TaxID=2053833 RepID=UPI001864FC63|nr:hypothetical protein [Paramagnetospirillum kuznetsovii]
MPAIALIDCENLSSDHQRGTVRRWAEYGRIELFGREAFMAPWRLALTKAGMAWAAETVIAHDAPSQAADQAMARRVDALIASPQRPERIAIASNDKGFDADIARAMAAGLAAERHRDLSHPQLLRLVVEELAGDGWASAGGVGDHLRRRFGIRLNGRIDDLARAAGLEMRRDGRGVNLRAGRPRSPILTADQVGARASRPQTPNLSLP